MDHFTLLWNAARIPPLHMLLPPRGSLEATQVASALVEQCGQWGVVTTVGYLRGARSRLAAFAEHEADIVLLSSGSAQMLMAKAAEEGYELFDVGNGSYYRPDSLVVVEKADSVTAARPRAVFLGEIDTGVWHQEPSLIPLDKIGLKIRPLERPEAQEMAEAVSYRHTNDIT